MRDRTSSHPSRRQALTGAAGAAAGLGILGAGPAFAAPRASGAGDPAARAALQAKAAAAAKGMSLEEKLGQLFVVEVYGRGANEKHAKNRELYGVDTPAQVIRKYKPGGVIYFDARRGPDNVGDPRQIAELSNGLQKASRTPLIISVDQEGGSAVYRLTAPATLLPGNMALGATRSAADSQRSAEIIGTELAAVGINQNYAPDADVNINPDNPVIGVRSFGSNAGLVSEMVAAAVKGFHRGGVATAAKHFPGHGDTAVDSHFGLPQITHTREELDRFDLPPFRAAIKRGVDTIMTAHIVVPSLDDSGVPATMSHPIITGLLREELGFDGLIVTDALDMQGASDEFPSDVAPVRALQAGCDQLVLAPEMDVAFAAVLAAVKSGEISEERVDASLLRVLVHKMNRGLLGDVSVSAPRAERVVGRASHLEDAQAITDRTVTLVRNQDLLPLTARTKRSVLVAGPDAVASQALADAMAKRRKQSATVLSTGSTPDAAMIDQAVAAAAEHDVVVYLSNATSGGAAGATAQAALVAALHEGGAPLAVVAVRNPYDIKSFPDVPAYLATYSWGAVSMESVARAVYGEINPSGALPVPIPTADGEGTLYAYGHGLRY